MNSGASNNSRSASGASGPKKGGKGGKPARHRAQGKKDAGNQPSGEKDRKAGAHIGRINAQRDGKANGESSSPSKRIARQRPVSETANLRYTHHNRKGGAYELGAAVNESEVSDSRREKHLKTARVSVRGLSGLFIGIHLLPLPSTYEPGMGLVLALLVADVLIDLGRRTTAIVWRWLQRFQVHEAAVEKQEDGSTLLRTAVRLRALPYSPKAGVMLRSLSIGMLMLHELDALAGWHTMLLSLAMSSVALDVTSQVFTSVAETIQKPFRKIKSLKVTRIEHDADPDVGSEDL